MKYLLMIYDDEAARWNAPRPEHDALTREYAALVQELTAESVYVGGAPLRQTTEAASVRVRDGQRQVTDGPFAETREQLGGYFLVEVETRDQAIAIAARIPGARAGTIEVRALADHLMPH